jgi:ArsR family transcriptional regulator, arsenate/arsenite/antimonite-responsive transcriptional repressor
MDSVFKALSDPTRRKILQLLKQKDLTVSEILEHFPITQPSLSHHLDALKRAGLVVPERNGQFIVYSINLSVFEEVEEFILNFFSHEK